MARAVTWGLLLPVFVLAAGWGCWGKEPPSPDHGADVTVTTQPAENTPSDPAAQAVSKPAVPERPARYWADRANLERAHGFREEALPLYDQALAVAEEGLRSSVLFQKGSCLRELDRFAEAAEVFDQARKAGSTPPGSGAPGQAGSEDRLRATEALAEVLEELQKPAESLALREELLLARAAASDLRLAAADLRAYVELVRKQGQIAGATAAWLERQAKDPKNPFVRRVLAELYATTEPVKAAEILSGLIEENPRDLAIRERLVFLYRQAGMLAEAEAALEKIAQDHPNRREQVLEQVAGLRIDRGDAEGAKRALSELRGLPDKGSPTWIRLAGRYTSLELWEDAEACYHEAVRTARTPAERQQYELSLAEFLRGRGKYDDAESLLNTLQAAPATPEVEKKAQQALENLKRLRRR